MVGKLSSHGINLICINHNFPTFMPFVSLHPWEINHAFVSKSSWTSVLRGQAAGNIVDIKLSFPSERGVAYVVNLLCRIRLLKCCLFTNFAKNFKENFLMWHVGFFCRFWPWTFTCDHILLINAKSELLNIEKK